MPRYIASAEAHINRFAYCRINLSTDSFFNETSEVENNLFPCINQRGNALTCLALPQRLLQSVGPDELSCLTPRQLLTGHFVRPRFSVTI